MMVGVAWLALGFGLIDRSWQVGSGTWNTPVLAFYVAVSATWAIEAVGDLWRTTRG